MRDFTVNVFDQCNTFHASEIIPPDTFRNLRSYRKMENERQFTRNAILWRVRVTTVMVQTTINSMCH